MTKIDNVEGLIALLREYVAKEEGKFDGQIHADTRLLDAGIIDSLSFVTFISFLEERTGESLDLSDFDIDDFDTPQNLFSALADLGLD